MHIKAALDFNDKHEIIPLDDYMKSLTNE